MKKKNTNQLVEELAISVQKGFLQIEKRFDEVDKRFEEVDERFEEVDKRFNKVDEQLEQIEGYVTGHGNRIDRLADDMRIVKTKVGIR